jgi:hypothetical protein
VVLSDEAVQAAGSQAEWLELDTDGSPFVDVFAVPAIAVDKRAIESETYSPREALLADIGFRLGVEREFAVTPGQIAKHRWIARRYNQALDREGFNDFPRLEQGPTG